MARFEQRFTEPGTRIHCSGCGKSIGGTDGRCFWTPISNSMRALCTDCMRQEKRELSSHATLRGLFGLVK